MRKALFVGISAMLIATSAQAQAWDTPSFMPPRPGEDIGVYLTDPEGAEFGIHGIWRQRGNLNLGLRLGYVDALDGAIVLGAETWGGLFNAGPDFPVDVSWTLGAGAGFNGGTLIEIPAGVSIGRTFMLSPITFQVYGHPRLALFILSANDETDPDLEALFDLGADIHMNPDWKVRLGWTLGRYDALGVGFAYRFGRGVAVR